MKITTVERYIKYSDKKYSYILSRAVKGGLTVSYGETVIIEDTENRSIELIPHNRLDLDEGMAACIYNYKQAA